MNKRDITSFLEVIDVSSCDDKLFSLKQINSQAGWTVTSLVNNHIFVLHQEEDICNISFGLFEFSRSDDKKYDDLYQCIFYGNGTGGSLKELRHTWFTSDGYVFYMNMEAMIAAMKELQKYFDD